MGTVARTERGHFVFTVKEQNDGTPWILLEPWGGTVSAMEDAVVGFELAGNATRQSAEQIATFLNSNLGDLTFTMFSSHRYFS